LNVADQVGIWSVGDDLSVRVERSMLLVEVFWPPATRLALPSELT